MARNEWPNLTDEAPRGGIVNLLVVGYTEEGKVVDVDERNLDDNKQGVATGGGGVKEPKDCDLGSCRDAVHHTFRDGPGLIVMDDDTFSLSVSSAFRKEILSAPARLSNRLVSFLDWTVYICCEERLCTRRNLVTQTTTAPRLKAFGRHLSS